MNQKLNLSQIKEIRQHYKDDEIYKIVKTVVCPAETNFKSFEFSAEACFVNVMDILSQIRDKTIRVEDVHNLWHQTTNDFFRDDHSANKEEIKQAVSMSFLFVAQALSTSKWPIYNYHLARQFIETVAAETESLTEEYNKIIDQPFPDCWFDYFMRGQYKELDNKFALMQQHILQETDKDKITAQNIYFIDKQENHNCQQFPGSIHDSSFITKQ